MNMSLAVTVTERPGYARCTESSVRIRRNTDADMLRGRSLDFSKKFLPDDLSKVGKLAFLNADEQRLLSQIQGRTYASLFGLVRFGDEAHQHPELFRRIERMIGAGMPAGYRFLPPPDEVASVVLGKSAWAVLGLSCHIALFTQAHYRSSIEAGAALSELYRDVFLFHWCEVSQHAIRDELALRHEHARLSPAERDQAVDDLIELVGAVDGILRAQSATDAGYFMQIAGRDFTAREAQQLRTGVLRAYRWQYILSGVQEPRFAEVIGSLVTDTQGERISEALAPLTH